MRQSRRLSKGEPQWREYLQVTASTGHNHWALLEFDRGDRPEADHRFNHKKKDGLLEFDRGDRPEAFLEDAWALQHLLATPGIHAVAAPARTTNLLVFERLGFSAKEPGCF